MNYDRQLQGSFWLMIGVQTVGSLDMPGKGPRKLPSPRSFVAAILVWAILGLISDAGASKAAAAMGWVTVLTGIIVGPFGKVVVSLFETVGTKFVAEGPPEKGGPDSGDTTPHKRATTPRNRGGNGPIIA